MSDFPEKEAKEYGDARYTDTGSSIFCSGAKWMWVREQMENDKSQTVLVTKYLWEQIMQDRVSDRAELEQLRGCSRGRKACDVEIDGLKESLAKTNRKLSETQQQRDHLIRSLHLMLQTTLSKKGILGVIKDILEWEKKP